MNCKCRAAHPVSGRTHNQEYEALGPLRRPGPYGLRPALSVREHFQAENDVLAGWRVHSAALAQLADVEGPPFSPTIFSDLDEGSLGGFDELGTRVPSQHQI